MSTTSDERTRPSHSRHILREVDKIVQGNPSDPAAAEMLSALRGLGPDAAQMIDQILLGRIGQQRSAIEDTREILDQLQEEIDKLTAAPWVPGRFLRLDMSRDRTCALVHAAGAMRLVELSDEVDADALGRGAWVYLNYPEMRCRIH